MANDSNTMVSLNNDDYSVILGSPPPQCDFPNNVGLWVDALTFAVFTIQIAIFDSQFSEIMRDYLVETSTRGDK